MQTPCRWSIGIIGEKKSERYDEIMKTIERINEYKFGRIVETKEIGSHTTPSLANLVVGIFKFKSQVLTTPKGFTNGRFFSFPKRFPLRGPENPNVEIKRDKNSPLQVDLAFNILVLLIAHPHHAMKCIVEV